MTSRREQQRRFWGSVPLRSLAVLLAAIFFTFGSLGFLQDVLDRRHSLGHLGFSVVVQGLTAVGIALCIMRGRRFLPVPLAFLAAFVVLGPREVGLPQRVGQAAGRQLELDAFGAIAWVILGYGCFISFIARRGVKELRLQTEIALARELHEVLVPPVERVHARYEIFGRSSPSSEIGGDLLDVVAQDGGLTCYVADVSGHGVPAGALMGMVKSATRMRLRTECDLAQLLTELNPVLLDLKQSNMFVTWAGVRLPPSGAATYALAGHLPILHFRHATGAVARLAVSHLPLGILASETFTSCEVRLAPGDVLALLTDGLTEVVDAHDVEFGLEGVEQTLRRHTPGQPLPLLFDTVLAAVAAHGKAFRRPDPVADPGPPRNLTSAGR